MKIIVWQAILQRRRARGAGGTPSALIWAETVWAPGSLPQSVWAPGVWVGMT